MRRSLRMLVSTAIACVAIAGLAVMAAAHTARHDSLVSIRFQRGHQGSPDTFSGRVVSTNVRCERNRIVAVRQRVDGPDPLVGTDSTNSDGEWELEVAS